MVRRILIIAIHCDQLWRIFFAAFLAVLSTVSSAQHHQADSVNALLIGKADGERADIFYELSYQYGDQDYALALGYSDRSLQFARRSGDSLRIVKAARIKAWIFRQLEEMDSSLRLGLEILPIASRNHYNDEVKKILRGLATAYSFKANFDRGLQYHFELLRITEQDGDSAERAFVLNNIGMVYMQLLNYKKALHYFHRSLAIDPPLYEIKMTTVLLNTSLCYSQLRDFEKAREYLQKGFDKSQSTNVGTIAIEGLNVKGSFYLTKGELDSAETFFLRSYALAKDLPSERYQLVVIFKLAQICLDRNQLFNAEQYLLEAESLLQKTPFRYEVRDIYSRLSILYKRIGKRHKRILSQEKYIQYSDSIYNRTTLSNLMKVEGEFHERRNKAKIAKQEQVLALRDEVINRQLVINILVGIFAALLITLLYVLYRSNREKKFANQLLEQMVQTRTQALELSYARFKQTLGAKEAVLTKTLSIVRQHFATLSGLCVVGLRETTGSPAKQCFQQLSREAAHTFVVLDKVEDTKSLHGS